MKNYIVSTIAIDEYETGNLIEIMTLEEFTVYMEDAIRKSQIANSCYIISKKLTEDDFSENILNSKGYPLNIGTTVQFRNGIKDLIKKHKNKILEKLAEVIEDLANLRVTTQYKNHRLKNSALNDVHIKCNVILLYRYVGDAIIVTLKLSGITNHDNLEDTAKQIEK